MKSVNYDKDIKELYVILICLIIGLGYIIFVKFTYNGSSSGEGSSTQNNDVVSFNENFVKNINVADSNYLVSPYSVEMALRMLANGSSGNTMSEIINAVGDRTVVNFNVNNRIGVANALFIKDLYKNYIISSFSDGLKSSYNGDIVYDKFENADVINKWCRDKTSNMVDKMFDSLGADFVLGIANAVAIDVEWEKEFDCNSTSSSEFIRSDNSKINVEMMHNTYSSDVKYFENDSVTGVVIPYKKYNVNGEVDDDGSNLEFVGILPSGNINDFIQSLGDDDLSRIDNNSITASADKNVELSLPRFKYDFKLDSLVNVLQNMGIRDAFDMNNADFTKIINKDDMLSLGIDNLYVDTAVHKTYIDLNEKGTKAAAVTGFNLNAGSAATQPEIVKIEFNKPFIYIIRDSQSKEMLFFGAVYNPSEWKGNTCNNE